MRRRWPRGRHPGGLAWEVATDQLPATVARLHDDAGTLVGWSGVEAPGDLAVEAEPAAASRALAAAVDAATGPQLRIAIATDDVELQAAAQDQGFEAVGAWHGMFRRASVEDRPAGIPGGYVVRAARPDEDEARIVVHRRAWRPADLPWHPDHRPPVDPEAESGFGAEQLGRLRAARLHDPDLDLVVEAPDGELVACCTVWFDGDLGVAEIEPLGVTPAHRRRGLAGALCLEASARVAERGGWEVFLNAEPRVAYPANHGAYTKAGFALRARGASWERGGPGSNS